MAFKSVRVKKYSDHEEEFAAGGTITPGMFIEVNSAGAVIVPAVAGVLAVTMVALEDELQGRDIDDNYSSGDRVKCWIPWRGDQVLAILAAGENVAIGAPLYVGANGKVYEVTSGTEEAVGEAVEAVNAVADSRIALRVF